VQQTSRDVAMHLAAEIEATGAFRLISRGDQVPAFAFTTAAPITTLDVFDASNEAFSKAHMFARTCVR
jgi:glutamate decarboxylase